MFSSVTGNNMSAARQRSPLLDVKKIRSTWASVCTYYNYMHDAWEFFRRFWILNHYRWCFAAYRPKIWRKVTIWSVYQNLKVWTMLVKFYTEVESGPRTNYSDIWVLLVMYVVLESGNVLESVSSFIYLFFVTNHCFSLSAYQARSTFLQLTRYINYLLTYYS